MEISEIKSRLSLAELLGQYGEKYDSNGKGCCPFHEDKKPAGLY